MGPIGPYGDPLWRPPMETNASKDNEPSALYGSYYKTYVCTDKYIYLYRYAIARALRAGPLRALRGPIGDILIN